jgi:sigma-B regulation protein RsbU (phosphoserine phosphatase)
MSPFAHTIVDSLRRAWRRSSLLDGVSLLLVLLEAVWWLSERMGLRFAPPGFLTFLFFLAAAYLLVRVLLVWRAHLLWSLRNRLVVAYLFIAVVPVLLLLTLALLSAQILYSQLGGYLLYEDLHRRAEMMADAAEHIAAAEETLPKAVNPVEAERMLAAQAHTVHDRDLPGLQIAFDTSRDLLDRIAKDSPGFSGIVQQQDRLFLVALRAAQTPSGPRVVSLKLPVSSAFLEKVAPDLGPIQLTLVEPVEAGSRRGIVYQSGSLNYSPAGRIGSRQRSLQPAVLWFDFPVNGFTKLDAVYIGPKGEIEPRRPVFAVYSARPSRLNARIFSSLGELRGAYFVAFAAVTVVFLLIEIAALVTGVVLTRTITKAINELYRATQYVQAGDLSHRVRIERRDQLGVLGESFNLMTSSISSLIEEQKQRQRLENELSIAREVQSQLFPRELPAVEGVELEAICRAARVVSGDYYDFIQLGPTQLAFAIADISGKGISAALLMASLQASLRSQVLIPGAAEESTADLVCRLNRHLVRNTGDDRFATFFYAVYDAKTRLLRYTNAGHLPSLFVCDGKCHRLEKGGMVLGVVEDYVYEEGVFEVPRGSVLVGYSDGLVEPENVYGEEFGIRRLEDTLLRVRSAPPRVIADSLMIAADEWAGTPEQFDDMTVIVARLS